MSSLSAQAKIEQPGRLSDEDFVAALRNIGDVRYHDKHPFNLRMHAGELSKEEMQRWILNRYYYQKNLPIKDAVILSKLEGKLDRQKWLKRIIDQDGDHTNPGGLEAWLLLGEAAGLDRAKMIDCGSVLKGVRFAVDAYVNFCRYNTWLEAVAASLTELFAPKLVSHRLEVMDRHYGFIDKEGLYYFHNRLSQAPRDADHALSMVVGSATTGELQENAMAALNFKCDVLWSMLTSIERDD